MKYISTLIFAAALILTWNLIHKESVISYETHAAIQFKLIDVIHDSILELKPQAQNIKFLDFATEPVNDTTVKAYFSYKFLEPEAEGGDLTEQTIQGEALLHRSKGVDPTQDHWTMEDVKTQTGELTFKNGITISPIPVPGEETEKPEAKAPEAPSEEGALSAPTPTPEPTELPKKSDTEKVYE